MQNLFHPAGLFEEVFPIGGGKQAQADKTVGHNGIVRRRIGIDPAQAGRAGPDPGWDQSSLVSS